MKIIGFAQLRNELNKGNLKNWFRSMSFCDYIYIYDQNSTDGSLDYYKEFDNTVVIESPINDFINELKCKNALLQKLLEEHPDVDWIVWMDGDTILDARLTRNDASLLNEMLEMHLKNDGVDSIVLGHYNLWRSDVYYRIDNLFHWLHENGVCAMWKNNGKLKFDPVSGLHREQKPDGLETCVLVGFSLIHRGFATDDQIIGRIDHYNEMSDEIWDQKDREHYISGVDIKNQTIERFLNEKDLKVERIPTVMIPDWLVMSDTINPINKKKIREIYEERNRDNHSNI